MAAPKNNQNRLGKIGKKYNMSMPRLRCDTCLANDVCPLYKPGPTPCLFLRKMRGLTKLDTIEDIRNVRKQVIIDSLVQLSVHSMVTERTGVSEKEDITFRKVLMDQLKELERDEFTQSIKKVDASQHGALASIISEVRKEKALNEPGTIDVPFKVE